MVSTQRVHSRTPRLRSSLRIPSRKQKERAARAELWRPHKTFRHEETNRGWQHLADTIIPEFPLGPAVTLQNSDAQYFRIALCALAPPKARGTNVNRSGLCARPVSSIGR